MISRRWGKADCGKGASAEDFRSTPKNDGLGASGIRLQLSYLTGCVALLNILVF